MKKYEKLNEKYCSANVDKRLILYLFNIFMVNILQQIIVNLQTEEGITIILCDHQARDLLSCVDIAIVISNCRIVAKGSPSELINNSNAKSAYFGDSFKYN